MGKTAVFVLATLQQLEPVDNQVDRLDESLGQRKSLDLGFGDRSLSRTRISLSNQSRIRTIRSLHEYGECLGVLRRSADEERRRHPEEQMSTHRRWNTQPNSRLGAKQSTESSACETFHHR